MSHSKPVILLIAGGWCTPKRYSQLIQLPSSAGYDVHVPSIPSMNGSTTAKCRLDE
jgi:hypothetical protein